jgi:Chitin binding Peritrophin-A domain
VRSKKKRKKFFFTFKLIVCFSLKLALPEIPDEVFIDCEDAPPGTYLPHPENCSFYFVCVENRSYLQECGDGLVFDIFTLRCQKEEKAQCVVQESTVTTNESITESV